MSAPLTPPPSPMTSPSLTPPSDIPPPARRSRTSRALGATGRSFGGLVWWKKLLLVLAIAMTIAGVAGSAVGAFKGRPAEARDAQIQVEQLRGVGQHSSLTAEQHQQLETAQAKVDQFKHWFYDQTAPQLWKIGLGFFIAFVLGFAARQFVKTVATLLALVVVLAGVALYMGWIDATQTKTRLQSGTGWVMERADSAKEAVLKFAGASLSGTAGFVIGFMRSRR